MEFYYEKTIKLSYKVAFIRKGQENFLSLMANWDDVAMYEEIATNAYGTATEKMNAYTDSVEAAQTRLTTAVEEWALKLNQSDAIKFFYDKLAFVVKNLDALAVSLLALKFITEPAKFISNIGNIFDKIGMRVANFSGAYSTKATSGVVQSAKDIMAQKELIAQQKLYAEALKTNVTGLNEMQQNNATIVQNQLLQMNANDKRLMSTMLLADAETAQATASVSELTAEGQLILVDTLLSQSKGVLNDEEINELQTVRNNIAATNNTISAEQDLATVTNALTKVRQNALNGNASTVIGGNLGQAANRSSWGKNIATGAVSMVGMLGGGFVGQKAAEYGGLGGRGQTANMMALGLGGQVFGKGLVGAISGFAQGGGLAGAKAGLLSALGASATATGAAAAIPIVGAAIAGAGVIGAAIYTGIKAHQKAVYDAANKNYEEAVESYNAMNQSRANASRYQELAKGVSNLGNNISLSDEEYQEFLDIGNELAALYPTLISHTDEWGNSMLLTAGKAGTLSDQIKGLMRDQQHLVDSALLNDDKFKTDYKDIKKRYDEAIVVQKALSKTQVVSDYEDVRNLDSKSFRVNLTGNNKIDKVIKDTLDGMYSGIGTEHVGAYGAGKGGSIRSYLKINENDTEAAQKALESASKKYNITLSSITKEFNSTVQALYRELQYDSDEYSDIINSFSVNQDYFMQELINTISPDLDKDEAKQKIRDMLVDYADLIKEETGNINEYYEDLEKATNSKEVKDAREKLKNILINLFGEDGYNENEIEIIAKFNFEVDAQGDLFDLEDIVYQYKQKFEDGVEGALSDDYLYNLSKAQAANLMQLIKEGFVDANTGEDIVNTLLYQMNEHSDKFAQAAFITKLSQAWNKELQTKLKQFFNGELGNLEDMNLAEITRIFAEFGLTPSLLQAIAHETKLVTDETHTATEAVEELGATYQRELKNAKTALIELQNTELFPDAGIEGVIDSFKELKAALDSVESAYNTLNSAMQEFNENGTISIETAIDMLASDDRYADVLEFDYDGIKLTNDAMNTFIEIRKEALRTQIADNIRKEAESFNFYQEQLRKLNAWMKSSPDNRRHGGVTVYTSENDTEGTRITNLTDAQSWNDFFVDHIQHVAALGETWQAVYEQIDYYGETTLEKLKRQEQELQYLKQLEAEMNAAEYGNGGTGGFSPMPNNNKYMEEYLHSGGQKADYSQVRNGTMSVTDYLSSVNQGLGLTNMLSGEELAAKLGSSTFLADYINDAIKQAGEAFAKGTVDIRKFWKDLQKGWKDAQKQMQNEIDKTQLKLDVDKFFKNANIDGVIDTFSELKSAMEDIVSDFDILSAAMQEQNVNGRLSLDTIMQLVTADERWADYLEPVANGIGLKTDALNEEMTAEQAAIQSAMLHMQTEILLGVKTAESQAMAAIATAQAAQNETEAASAVVSANDTESDSALNLMEAAIAAAWGLEAQAQGEYDVLTKHPNPGAVEGFEGRARSAAAKVGSHTGQTNSGSVEVYGGGSSGSGGSGSNNTLEAIIQNLYDTVAKAFGQEAADKGIQWDADTLSLQIDPALDMTNIDSFNAMLFGGANSEEITLSDGTTVRTGGTVGLLTQLMKPENGYMDDLIGGSGKYKAPKGGGGGGGGGGSEDEYEPMDELDRLKEIIDALDKEFTEMLVYTQKGIEGLHNLGDVMNEMDAQYYETKRTYLAAAVNRAWSRLAATGITSIDQVLTLPYTEEGDEMFETWMDLYNDYIDLQKQLLDLDNERVEDYIDILEAQNASVTTMTQAYRELQKTADSVKTYYEYQQKIVDSLEDEYELRKSINDFHKDFALTLADYYKYTESQDRQSRKAYEYIEEINTRGMQNAEYDMIRTMINEFRDQWWAAHDSNDPDRQERMDRAHEMAEKLRAKVGYSGGEDGSEYINLWGNKYDEYMNEALQALQDAAVDARTRYKDLVNDRYFQYLYETDLNGNYLHTKEEAYQMALNDEDVRDVLQEFVDYTKEIGEVRIQISQNQADLLDAKLSTYQLSMPEQWMNMGSITGYYSGQLSILNEQLANVIEAISDLSDVDDEVGMEWYQKRNDLVRAIREAQIEETEAKKEYQDSIYNAAVNEVNRYIDDLEREKELADKVYDDEIDKLNDKADAIDRTNRLLELQMALENAQNEKQRVYREGIGWVYEADRKKIKDAQKDLDDFYLDDKIDDLENAKDEEGKILDERINQWNKYLEMLEYQYGEYDRIQERKLLMEELGVTSEEEIYNTLLEDMTSYNTEYERLWKEGTTKSDELFGEYISVFEDFYIRYKRICEELWDLSTSKLNLLSWDEILEGLKQNDNMGEILDIIDEDALEEQYDKYTDYSAKMYEALKLGDYDTALKMADLRDIKILGENLDPERMFELGWKTTNELWSQYIQELGIPFSREILGSTIGSTNSVGVVERLEMAGINPDSELGQFIISTVGYIADRIDEEATDDYIAWAREHTDFNELTGKFNENSVKNITVTSELGKSMIQTLGKVGAEVVAAIAARNYEGEQLLGYGNTGVETDYDYHTRLINADTYGDAQMWAALREAKMIENGWDENYLKSKGWKTTEELLHEWLDLHGDSYAYLGENAYSHYLLGGNNGWSEVLDYADKIQGAKSLEEALFWGRMRDAKVNNMGWSEQTMHENGWKSTEDLINEWKISNGMYVDKINEVAEKTTNGVTMLNALTSEGIDKNSALGQALIGAAGTVQGELSNEAAQEVVRWATESGMLSGIFQSTNDGFVLADDDLKAIINDTTKDGVFLGEKLDENVLRVIEALGNYFKEQESLEKIRLANLGTGAEAYGYFLSGTTGNEAYDYAKKLIAQYQADWNEADAKYKAGEISKEMADALKQAAHEGAEAIRQALGFTGGKDGSAFYALDGSQLNLTWLENIINEAHDEWWDAHNDKTLSYEERKAREEAAHIKAENARKAMGYSGGADGSGYNPVQVDTSGLTSMMTVNGSTNVTGITEGVGVVTQNTAGQHKEQIITNEKLDFNNAATENQYNATLMSNAIAQQGFATDSANAQVLIRSAELTNENLTTAEAQAVVRAAIANGLLQDQTNTINSGFTNETNALNSGFAGNVQGFTNTVNAIENSTTTISSALGQFVSQVQSQLQQQQQQKQQVTVAGTGGGGGGTSSGSSGYETALTAYYGHNSTGSNNPWQSDINSIQAAKDAWNDAHARGDEAGMKAAHDAAESIRNSYGYSGGDDGDSFIYVGGSHAEGIETGPVTYTGLGMLHGTPNKPEYVLNNDQAYNVLRYIASGNKPKDYESTINTNDMSNTTQYIVEGDIVLENCDDPAEFWNDVMSAVGSRWSTTKNKRN